MTDRPQVSLKRRCALTMGGALLPLALLAGPAGASSHMDAPLITLDDPANTTDVYAFRSQDEDGDDYLTAALAVYPFQEPGIGPNTHRFADDARYNIHVALGDDAAAGQKTLTYQFTFNTKFVNEDIILQAYLGQVDEVFGDNQNMRQSYKVVKVDERSGGGRTVLGRGLMVPPNNQGLVTPFYNQGDDGEMPAKGGVASGADLDVYTAGAVAELDGGYRVFAGQRDDGFYADIQSIFDLDFTFGGDNKPFDSQGGFNVHTIVIDIPLEELEGAENVGVYATVERKRQTILARQPEQQKDRTAGGWIQVARQGNPLFNEALVGTGAKDLYNRTAPTEDQRLFAQFALAPQLAGVLGLPAEDRDDIAGIFIPDLIKVDLTTGPVPLAGDGDFNRLGVFGGDTVMNAAGADVPSGWPNGRRFGDDVIEIALIALGIPAAADLDVDGVSANDITYNQVFPYAATPLNGRNHGHH